jgi:segregation and condensation protein B
MGWVTKAMLSENAPPGAGLRPDVAEPLLLVGAEWQPLSALLESLLFVADKPTSASQLAKTLGLTLPETEAGLARLAETYVREGRGLRLQEQHGCWRLVTMPEAASLVETFLHLDFTTKLSAPALETLAIIAYRQPVTRPQIEAVRGVDCGAVLRSLIQRGLVEEVGRLESVGRPILYSVTEHFMHHFGLISMRDLPPLEQQDEELLAAAPQVEE